MAKNGGPKAGLLALELAENPKELGKIAKLSNRFGEQTASVLKIVGKGLFRLADIILSLILGFLPLLFSALLGLGKLIAYLTLRFV